MLLIVAIAGAFVAGGLTCAAYYHYRYPKFGGFR